MSGYCTLFSQTFYGLLFSYLTITDVTSYVHHKFQFLSCCTSQPKKLYPIITVNSSTNAPITKKNNACTLCMPMFFAFCPHDPSHIDIKYAFMLAI